MKNVQAESCEYLENLLWQNELEHNRRELAIFESFLMNKGEKVQPNVYKVMMEQIHELLRGINKLSAEVTLQKTEGSGEVKKEFPAVPEAHVAAEEIKKVDNRYFREAMFYYEQNYRVFRKEFCEFVNCLEYA